MGAAARFLLVAGVLILPHSPVTAQGTERPSGLNAAFTVAPGYSTAYQGGVSYLASILFSRPAGIPLEAAFELVPTSYGNGDYARIFWVGVQYPRGLPARYLYAGTRVGLLKGPFHDGFLVDMHAGMQLGGRGIGLRLEPALLAGADQSLFVGARLAAGLSWTYRRGAHGARDRELQRQPGSRRSERVSGPGG